MSEIGKIVGLRCPHCGAKLPKTKEELVTCGYCGTTSRVEEADKYLQHLQGFVLQWIRKAFPIGMGSTYSGSIDPLARHNIFTHNIFPDINSEFGQIKLDAFEAFALPLILPPFVKRSFSILDQKDPKSFFSYDAKVSSILPMAVDSDDQVAVQKMGGLSRAYAHVLIGLDLLSKSQSLTYKAVAENFKVAATSTQGKYDVLSKRFLALSKMYLAIDDLLSNKTPNSRKRINEAKELLKEALSKSTFDINLSICSPAIEQEIKVAETICSLIDIVEQNFGNQLENIRKIENFFSSVSEISQVTDSNWRIRFENLGRYSELTRWFCLIVQAKTGKLTIKITPGIGNILFPFWVTEINYTFGTGKFWMRKGKCANEKALVAATFPLCQGFSVYPSEVVTDIFSMKPERAYVRSIIGSENSISSGDKISMLIQQASLRSASSYKIIPPLSTGSEAKQIMNEYLSQVSRRLQDKLHVASCDITDIIFVPVDISTGFVNFRDTLSYIQPRKLGDLNHINSLIV